MVMLGIQEAMHAGDSGHRGDWDSRHGETPGKADMGGGDTGDSRHRGTLETAETGDTGDSRH